MHSALIPTPEEASVLFQTLNTTSGSGTLESLVLTAHDRSMRQTSFNADELSKIYAQQGCENTADLVLLLAENEQIKELGSNEIDLRAFLDNNPMARSKPSDLFGLHIGSLKLGITPFNWLALLSTSFSTLHPKQREVFNLICKDFYQRIQQTT